MYVPQPSRGRAYPGQVIFINCIPQPLQPKPQSNPGQSPKSRTGHGQATPVTQKRATDPLALVGKTLAGYEVVDYLGEGGTGYVYLVRTNGMSTP